MAHRRRSASVRRRATTLAVIAAALVLSGAVVVGSVPAAIGRQQPTASAPIPPTDAIARQARGAAPPERQQAGQAPGAAPVRTTDLPASTDSSIRSDLPLGISRAIPTASPTPPAHTTTRARARAARAVPRPVAAFLGDSYTTGWVGAGLGRAGWPSIVSRAFGWRSRVRAVAGTGFVNPGWTRQPMRTQVGAVIRLRPGIVFVAGGHNDRRFATSASVAAADAVLDRLRRGLPDAVLVVIGPIWANDRPPASIQALRDHLRRKARAIGALFIDPLREGWFAGRAHRFIGPDGIHPTNAGHRHIAAMVLADLRAARVATRP